MYQIKDIVELGHIKDTGGSVIVALHFDEIVTDPEPYLNIIDSLDHTVITDNADIVKMSDRHFLLDESKSIFEDIITVMSSLIAEHNSCSTDEHTPRCVKCTVSLNKIQFSSELKAFSKLISMCNKG